MDSRILLCFGSQQKFALFLPRCLHVVNVLGIVYHHMRLVVKLVQYTFRWEWIEHSTFYSCWRSFLLLFFYCIPYSMNNSGAFHSAQAILLSQTLSQYFLFVLFIVSSFLIRYRRKRLFHPTAVCQQKSARTKTNYTSEIRSRLLEAYNDMGCECTYCLI